MFKKRMKEIQTRMAEIEKELDAPNADLAALEEESRKLTEEFKGLEERQKAAEERRRILDGVIADGTDTGRAPQAQEVRTFALDTPEYVAGTSYTPHNQYISGGLMAAPTVRDIFLDILPYLGVEPSYSETEKTYMDKTVPNVTGLSVEQAKAALEEVGLQARVYGEGGTVTAQLPGSGAVVASGSTILLYAGKEPSADKETMPDLTNLSYQTARDRMAALGLYIKTNSSITDTAQIVSGQTVAAGTQLDHGTVVEVTLVTSDSSMLGRY